MSLVNIPFGFMSEADGVEYLLDAYGTDVNRAYSVRQLSSTATNCLQVKRASDSATQNIGFVNNELDTASIASFCSGTTGYVSIWYDQSSNGYDAIEATTNGPVIFDAGSVPTSSIQGKPMLDYADGATDSSFGFNTNWTAGSAYAFYIYTSRGTAATYTFGGTAGGSKPAFINGYVGSNVEWFASNRYTISSGASIVDPRSYAVSNDGTTVIAHFDGTQAFSNPAGGIVSGANMDTIGGSGPSNDLYGGNMQEFIIFDATKTSDRSSILANQNAYFATY